MTSRLEVTPWLLQRMGDEYLVPDAGFIGYHPADPDLGGYYNLISRDGMKRTIDATTGVLRSITDRNGNRLGFAPDAITSDTVTTTSV